MDISFYILLTLACMVLLLAMWACAASGTTKWGPDLTLELPPHLLQEALFGPIKPINTKETQKDSIPGVPSDLPSAPLLGNEQPMGFSRPPLRSFHPTISVHADTAVRVLPHRYEPLNKTKPVLYKFCPEEPA